MGEQTPEQSDIRARKLEECRQVRDRYRPRGAIVIEALSWLLSEVERLERENAEWGMRAEDWATPSRQAEAGEATPHFHADVIGLLNGKCGCREGKHWVGCEVAHALQDAASVDVRDRLATEARAQKAEAEVERLRGVVAGAKAWKPILLKRAQRAEAEVEWLREVDPTLPPMPEQHTKGCVCHECDCLP